MELETTDVKINDDTLVKDTSVGAVEATADTLAKDTNVGAVEATADASKKDAKDREMPSLRVLASENTELSERRTCIDGFQPTAIIRIGEGDSELKTGERILKDVKDNPTSYLWYAPGTSETHLGIIRPAIKACYQQHDKGAFYFISLPEGSKALPRLEELATDTGGLFIRFWDAAFSEPKRGHVLLTNVPITHLQEITNKQHHGEGYSMPPDEGRRYSDGLIKAITTIMVNAKNEKPLHHQQLTVGGQMSVAIRSMTSRLNREGKLTVVDTGAEASTVTTQPSGAWRFRSTSERNLKLSGFGAKGKEVSSRIGTACSVAYDVNNKKILLVLNETALQTGDLPSLVDTYQLRNNGWKVIDSLEPDDGIPRMEKNGVTIPFRLTTSIMLETYYPTDEEMESLPEVELTSAEPGWDRGTYMNYRMNEINAKRNIQKVTCNIPPNTATAAIVTATTIRTDLNPIIFDFLTPEVRKQTAKATTQLQNTEYLNKRDMPKSYKANPALSTRRVDERVATDTMYSRVKSLEGLMMAQIFVHTKSKVLYAHPLRARTEMTTAIEACFIANGIPTELRSDNAKEISGARVDETLRKFHVKRSFSEPHMQFQNPAESWIGYLSRQVLRILEVSGAPPEEWWSALLYAIHVHNRTANRNLGWRTPLEMKDGETPDVSDMNQFKYYQRVIYKAKPSERTFPNPNTSEGRYLRPAQNTGGVFASVIRMTTGLEIYRSQLRRNPKEQPSLTETEQGEIQVQRSNLFDERVLEISTPFKKDETTPVEGEEASDDEGAQGEEPVMKKYKVVQEEQDYDGNEERIVDDDFLNPWLAGKDRNKGEELSVPGQEVGKSIWIKQPGSNGEAVTNGRVSRDYIDKDDERMITVEFRNKKIMADDITMSYEEYLEGIIEPETSEENRGIKHIVDARQVRLEDKSYIWQGKAILNDASEMWIDWEPLREDAPLILAEFVESMKKTGKIPKKFLLKEQAWAKEAIKLHDETKSIQVLRLMSLPYRFDLKFGVRCPNGLRSANEIDKELDRDPQLSASVGHQRWSKAIEKEQAKFKEHKAFEFMKKGSLPPKGYQIMRCHFVFDVKADGTFKARFVAGGNSVDATNINSAMSVVETAHTRVLFAVAGANNQSVLIGDLASAYLHALTLEKVCFICGPEWGIYEGCIAIVIKAVYGLVGSAHAYHRHVFDVMQGLGWKPADLDHNIWRRLDKDGKLYDYIAFYVDDFIIVSNQPSSLAEELGEIFSIKEIGPPSRYLGADVRWVDGYFHFSSSTYLSEVLDQLQRTGSLEEDDREMKGLRKFPTPFQFKEGDTPLTPGDHPELDNSDLLSDAGQNLYQRLIGILQWIVHIGRYDVCFATSSLSRFSSAPREGHLNRVKRIFGYLRANPNKSIKINPSDIEDLPPPMSKDVTSEMRSQYPESIEERSERDPVPRGETLSLTVFVDSDHAHDKKTCRSITGLLGFIGCTPIMAKSKRQTSVESSTYGAEFSAARSATEYIIGMRLLLRSMGVPVKGPTVLLGDNRGVVLSATQFTSVLAKKHHAISYHKVRECIAAGIVDFRWIEGMNNLADLMTKPVTKATQAILLERFMY
jgi:hypothetical protein